MLSYVALSSLFIVQLFSVNTTFAVTLGKYSNSKNLPGYIDFNKKSSFYNGPLSLKDKNDGLNRQTPSQILETYFEGEYLSIGKLKGLIEKAQFLEKNSITTYCQTEFKNTITNSEDCSQANFIESYVQDKWSKSISGKSFVAFYSKLNKAIQEANKLTITKSNINALKNQNFLANFFDAIEIFESLRGEDEILGYLSGIAAGIVKGGHFVFESPEIQDDRTPAANLLKIQTPSEYESPFYSEAELNQLKSQGYDLSLLNPMDSGFWRKPTKDISSYNTKNYDKTDIDSLKKIFTDKEIDNFVAPSKEISVVYTGKLPKSGSTPKLDVYIGEKKTKFKIKFVTDKMGGEGSSDPFVVGSRAFQGSEVNVEPVVNNLAAAIGYTIDPTYYKKKVRLYFPEKVYRNGEFESYYQKFVQQVDKRFGPTMSASTALKAIKIDENGKKYLEVKAVSIEQKASIETDFNAGFFVRHGLGKSLKREHRAFAIFLAWIMDPDTKDDNVKLKLVPETDENGNIDYKVAYSAADMGGSLGLNFPNLFNFNLVKDTSRNSDGKVSKIEFNYRKIYGLKIMSATDIDDAKWIARLIGQLSFKQIKDAFYAGGYPEIIAEYYAEILMKKRNQLLESLDLIDSYSQTVSGRWVTLTKEKEFNGTIPGFENFFSEGKLVDTEKKIFDPEVDIAPRKWGSDFSHVGGGRVSIWKAIALSTIQETFNFTYQNALNNMTLTNKGFNLFPIDLGGDPFLGNCTNNCFMNGIVAGAHLFIPYRYIIPNPLKDPKNKYWIVDIFRIGVMLGHNGESLLRGLGLSTPMNATLGFGGKFYKVNEFLKIHPVEDEDNMIKELSRLAKAPALSIKSARASFVKTMEEGDILVHSSYFGTKASLAARPTLFSAASFGPTIRLRGEILTGNRVTLLKEKNNKMLASWSKLKQSTQSARLNLVDFFLEVPLMEEQMRKLNKVDRTFEFDFNNFYEQNLLIENLSATTPENIPTPYRLELRDSEIKQRKLSFSLFGLLSHSRYSSKISVDYTNFKEKTSAYDLAYEKKHASKRYHHYDFVRRERVVKASINSNDDLYTKVKIKHEYPTAKREDFKDIYQWYRPVLPENFILFSPDSVKNYVGKLSVDIEVIINSQGLKEIFNPNWTEHSLCMRYAEVRHVGNATLACKDMSDKIKKFKRLKYTNGLVAKNDKSNSNDDEVDEDSLEDRFEEIWDEYEDARAYFWKVITLKNARVGKNRKFSYKALEEIVEMFADSKHFKYRTLRFYTALVSPQNLYRKASMTSSLDAFPGGVDEITETALSRGELEPSLRMVSDSPEEALEIFSDKIHKAVNPFMLTYLPEL